MPLYCFSYKLMIFNKYGYLVGDIKSVLLTDILDPVHKLPCDTFITQIVGYCYIKSDSEFAIIGNLPARNILGDYLNIFCCWYYLLTINCDTMISIVFKSCNLLWGESGARDM